jgi:hypothetical protein
MPGQFDPGRHPRDPAGQHGGGEFASLRGAIAPAASPTPVAAPVATPPMRSGAQSEQNKNSGSPSLIDRVTHVIGATADDIVVIALKGVMARNPNWFSLLAKAAHDDGRLSLRKYNADQPRDDRGQWTSGTAAVVAVASIAGGAGGAGAAALALRRAKARSYADARQVLAPIRATRAANAARSARHAGAEARIDAGLRRTRISFLPTALRSLRSIANHAGAELRQHMVAHSEPFWPDLSMDEPVWASTDAAVEADLRSRAEEARRQAANLKENGHAPRTVRVAGSMTQPKVASFDRTVRGSAKAIWADPQQVAALIAEAPEIYGPQGIHSISDASAVALSVPRKHLVDVMREVGLPVPRIRRPRSVQTVRNSAKVIPDHKRVIEGFPDAKGRKGLAAAIRRDVAARRIGWTEVEAPRAAGRVTAARTAARNMGGLAAMRRLGLLRAKGKAGIIAAGVLAAIAAGGASIFATSWQGKKVDKLTKAAPPDDPAKAIYEAGIAVEDTLATRLARMFGSWTEFPTEQLLSRGATLRTTFLTDLNRAMRPLDTATQAGAAVPVPAMVEGDDGHPRIVTLALDVGSQKVRDYALLYRVTLAGDMADEQLATIQSVLQDASLNGEAPARTARLLRQSLGLTPVQASHVLSFRRGLETLDPNVLGRAIRDQRYDKTLATAIRNQTPLTNDQVDRMVGAYQRRYLALRANTIARTEGVGAANNGHAQAVTDYLASAPAMTVVKTWSATQDTLTRPDHAALDGQQIVGMETPYTTVSGDTIRWPHDPNAPLRQKVNCRCTFLVSLVPRTAIAQRGFSLVADSPDPGGASGA